MCSWAREDTASRIVDALAGEGREEAARILIEETDPDYAAALIAELRGDVERVKEDDG